MIQLQVIRSRPDAALVLADVMASHSHTDEISVFVAGMSSGCNMPVSMSLLQVAKFEHQSCCHMVMIVACNHMTVITDHDRHLKKTMLCFVFDDRHGCICLFL